MKCKCNECYMTHQFCSLCLPSACVDTPKPWIISVDEAVSCKWFFGERRRWLIKELSSSGLSAHTDYKANLYWLSQQNKLVLHERFFLLSCVCVCLPAYFYVTINVAAAANAAELMNDAFLDIIFQPHPLLHIEQINQGQHIRFTFIEKKGTYFKGFSS